MRAAAPVLTDAIDKLEHGGADAVSCIVGAFDRLQITLAQESPAWRESFDRAADSLDGFRVQAARLVDWITGFEVHITNKKGNA